MKKPLKRLAEVLHLNLTGSHAPRDFFSSLATLLSLLISGSLFYSQVEGWTLVDSFYFTVITITTVGYGDLAPTTTTSKLFTIFLIFMGVGLGLFVISSLSESFRRGRDTRLSKIESVIKKLIK